MSTERQRYFCDRDVTIHTIEFLLVHVIACREVFDVAREHLRPAQLYKQEETPYRVIWGTLLELFNDHRVMPTFDALHTRVMETVESMPGVPPENIQATDDIVRYVCGRHEDTPEVFTPQVALEALEMILIDRMVAQQIRNASAGGTCRADGAVRMIEGAHRELETIRAACQRQSVPLLGEGQAAYEERVERYRGRQRIGLQTGLQILDDRTCGLRGLILLGAAPGVGKSVYALQLASGVCRYSVEHDNNACVLYLSLDMDADDVRDRLHCCLAGMDWATYRLGSQSLRENLDGPRFTEAHQLRLDDARQRITDWQLDRRVAIVGRDEVGQLSASKITGMAHTLRSRTGAEHCLIVVDYLQLLPVPEEIARQNDLEADKYRVRMVQQVVDASKGEGNRPRDTVIAISEARKPSTTSATRHTWGTRMEDLMGSARLGYAADAVLLMRPMEDRDLADHYNTVAGEQLREELAVEGVSPLIITLAKGRDGMVRGSWPAEFHYRESRISEGVVRRPDSTPVNPPHYGHSPPLRPLGSEISLEPDDILGDL
jgi:replicative DNA helicase